MKRLLVITLLILCSGFFGVTVNAQEEEELIASIGEPICLNPASVPVQVKKAPSNKGYVVYVGNKQAIWFVKDSAGLTAEERAEIVASKLEKISKK